MKTMFLKKVATLALVAVVAATFSPFGASAATTKYVSNQTILKEMVTKMFAIDAMNFEGTLSFKPPATAVVNSYEDYPFQKLLMKFYGSSNLERITNKKQSTFSLMVFDQSGADLYPHFDSVTDGGISYFKVSNLNWIISQLNSRTMLDSGTAAATTTKPFGLEDLDNKWISITPDSIKNLLTMSMDSAADSSSSIDSLTKIYLEEMLAERENESKQTMKKLGDVLKIAQQKNLFSISRLKDEVIDGTNSYHLKLILNKLRIKPFLLAAQKVLGGEQMTSKEIDASIKDFAKTQMTGIELWVGKDDFLLRKISMGLKIKESNLKNSPAAEVSFSLNLSSFNNTAVINAPSQSMKIEDIISKFFSFAEEKAKMTYPVETSSTLYNAIQ
jgi:hypothetical protein